MPAWFGLMLAHYYMHSFEGAVIRNGKAKPNLQQNAAYYFSHVKKNWVCHGYKHCKDKDVYLMENLDTNNKK